MALSGPPFQRNLRAVHIIGLNQTGRFNVWDLKFTPFLLLFGYNCLNIRHYINYLVCVCSNTEMQLNQNYLENILEPFFSTFLWIILHPILKHLFHILLSYFSYFFLLLFFLLFQCLILCMLFLLSPHLLFPSYFSYFYYISHISYFSYDSYMHNFSYIFCLVCSRHFPNHITVRG